MSNYVPRRPIDARPPHCVSHLSTRHMKLNWTHAAIILMGGSWNVAGAQQGCAAPSASEFSLVTYWARDEGLWFRVHGVDDAKLSQLRALVNPADSTFCATLLRRRVGPPIPIFAAGQFLLVANYREPIDVGRTGTKWNRTAWWSPGDTRSGVITVTWPSFYARYVKLVAWSTPSVPSNWFSVGEINLYEGIPAPPP